MVEQIPKGYKQTEVGVIPEDWEVVKLGNVSQKIGSGITPTGGSKIYKTVGHPFVRSQNVLWGKLDLSEIVYIDDDTHSTFIGTEIKKDDILLNITGASIGRAAIANDEIVGGNVNQHVCIIRPIESELSSTFLCTYLISSEGQRYIEYFQSGGNRQGLNFKQIASIIMPIPLLSEQTDIAEALSDMDNLIFSLEKLIAKKQSIKQGAMQELLTGKKRLSGFSGEWEERRIGEFLKFQVGYPFSSQFFNQKQKGIRLIKNRDLKSDDQIYFFSGEYFKEYLVRNGDVLVGMDGDFITCQWHKGTALLNQRVGRILVSDKMNLIFANYLLKNPLENLQRETSATTVKHLSHNDIEDLELRLPPLPEQTAIADILSDMDEEIEKLTRKLDKYKAIKQGMMQELLTGKVRLM